MATKNPILAKYWHSIKNGELIAYNVTCYSQKTVWWECNKGHEWEDTVAHRSNGRNCPYCNGIVLKGNILCNSIPEAYMYLRYKSMRMAFKHNKIYDKRFGRHKYDFYLKNENKYIEVTSFTSQSNYGVYHYEKYLQNIDKKRRFVEDILKAKFKFIQFIPTKKQIACVRKHQ